MVDVQDCRLCAQDSDPVLNICNYISHAEYCNYIGPNVHILDGNLEPRMNVVAV